MESRVQAPNEALGKIMICLNFMHLAVIKDGIACLMHLAVYKDGISCPSP